MIDEHLFIMLYSFVLSRAFGTGGCESTSLVPMADNANHDFVDV